jgi:alcohol dehydrogenase (cytochrome c)
VFARVANPYPDYNRDIIPDDKAFTALTDSVISVDAITGKLNWHYQAVPLDERDWDLATAPTVYRTPDGKEMIAVTGKSGRVYGLEGATGKLVLNTPGTSILNDQEPLDLTWKLVCPGLQGGAMFNGAAYHPGTGTLYVGMADHCAWYIKDKTIPPSGGAVIKDWSAAVKLQAPKGWITAMDAKTGAVLWTYQTESQVLAGLVPTKSGLLFGGDTHGNLLVFNATNGSLLFSADQAAAAIGCSCTWKPQRAGCHPMAVQRYHDKFEKTVDACESGAVTVLAEDTGAVGLEDVEAKLRRRENTLGLDRMRERSSPMVTSRR